jgi:hypothetical protein
VPAEERWGWQAGFETAFYERGLGVFHFSIKDINEVRKRKGLPLVVIEETGTTEYARETSRQVVAERRRALRDQIWSMTDDERRQTMFKAQAECRALPPPRMYYANYQEREDNEMQERQRSRQETARRLAALQQSEQSAKAADKLDRVIKMLSLTQDQELIGKIIDKLNPDEALQAAEKVENGTLRDILIEHSLAAL